MIVPDRLTTESFEALEKRVFGIFTWTLVFSVFPHKCCITGEYTKWFSKVYVGQKDSYLIPYKHPILKYAHKDAFLLAKLTGKSV